MILKKRPEMERALSRPDAAVRLYLLYGPDESGSRALADLLARAMGAEAERIDLAPGTLKGDPALLADEAASVSLFGGARHIRVDGAGEESLAAVEALLAAPAAGNPVALVAGALKPASKLLKAVQATPAALAFASWPPDERDFARLAAELGREAGLRLAPDIAGRVAASAGGDRAILAQEIAKYALFLDAAPDRPRELEADALDLLAADSGEADTRRLVDAVFGGRPGEAAAELARLEAEGVSGVGLVRTLSGRLLRLAELRAEVDRGDSVSAVIERQGKAVMWKDKEPMKLQLSRWTSESIARALDRLGEAGRRVMASGGPGPVAMADEVMALARQAERRR